MSANAPKSSVVTENLVGLLNDLLAAEQDECVSFLQNRLSKPDGYELASVPWQTVRNKVFITPLSLINHVLERAEQPKVAVVTEADGSVLKFITQP